MFILKQSHVLYVSVISATLAGRQQSDSSGRDENAEVSLPNTNSSDGSGSNTNTLVTLVVNCININACATKGLGLTKIIIRKQNLFTE